jgi:hypothetical protein
MGSLKKMNTTRTRSHRGKIPRLGKDLINFYDTPKITPEMSDLYAKMITSSTIRRTNVYSK